MTNHWIDIKNSDVVMCIGSNAAENHPISFKWVQEAMDNGGKLVVVDPRYTRTASKASVVDGMQLYSKLRSGTDIAFMLGMMKYAIDNNRVNWRYLRDCTNASFLLNTAFQTCRNQNAHPDTGTYPSGAYGIFSGLVDDPRRHKRYKYDTSAGGWDYQYVVAGQQPAVDRDLTGTTTTHFWDTIPPSGTPDPNSVWAKLIEQVGVYDIPTVSKITGADQAAIAKVYEVYTSTYEDDKSACIMYAMGSTQHTYGSQNVRSYAMMQLLLGNAGVAGGGINALRGESNVQGSTDMCLLWHILPGYLPVTTNKTSHKDRASYKASSFSTGKAPLDITPGGWGTGNPRSLSWWQFGGKYIDSMLQAWWPEEHLETISPGTIPTGQHGTGPGDDNSASLIDSAGRDFTTLGVRVGLTVRNTTDGSSGVVTAITTTYSSNDTLTTALSGGAEHDWDTGDNFVISGVALDKAYHYLPKADQNFWYTHE
jgi:formate dehydrogenase major subunit